MISKIWIYVLQCMLNPKIAENNLSLHFFPPNIDIQYGSQTWPLWPFDREKGQNVKMWLHIFSPRSKVKPGNPQWNQFLLFVSQIQYYVLLDKSTTFSYRSFNVCWIKIAGSKLSRLFFPPKNDIQNGRQNWVNWGSLLTFDLGIDFEKI